MSSRALPCLVACASAALAAASCGSSDSQVQPQTEAGVGGTGGADASAGSAGSGGVEAGPDEAAPDQQSGECKTGDGRCVGKTAQMCDETAHWQPCTTCPFLDTDPDNCGECGKVCDGTPCTGGKCGEHVKLGEPGGEAVAADATSVYWLARSWDEDAGLATRSVMKVGLQGGTPESLWLGSAGSAFAIDAASAYLTVGLYDADAGGWIAALLKVGLNGGNGVTLATTIWSPTAIALDAANVYWTSGNYVAKVEKTGGTPELLADGPWTGTAIAVDGSSVYWTNQGNDFTPGTVLKTTLAGGVPQVLATGQPWAHAMAIDATSVYWLTWDGVMKVGKNGGSPTQIAAMQNGDKGMMAIDDTAVYWTANGGTGYPSGRVLKVALSGGTPVVLTGAQEQPMGIAVDATSVYWATATAVFKIAK